MAPLSYMRSVVDRNVVMRPNCKFLTTFRGNNDISDLLQDWNFEPNKRIHSSWLSKSNSLSIT